MSKIEKYVERGALTIENLKKYMTVMEVLNIEILMMNGELAEDNEV